MLTYSERMTERILNVYWRMLTYAEQVAGIVHGDICKILLKPDAPQPKVLRVRMLTYADLMLTDVC